LTQQARQRRETSLANSTQPAISPGIVQIGIEERPPPQHRRHLTDFNFEQWSQTAIFKENKLQKDILQKSMLQNQILAQNMLQNQLIQMTNGRVAVGQQQT